MVKDQYQIPQNYSEPEIRAQIDAIQLSPEVMMAPYQQIKNIEEKIFSYREAALAVEKKPKGWLGRLVFTQHPQTIQDLIEDESKLGGQLFGEGNKFWLDAKTNDTVFQNDVADWYHVQLNPANPKRPTVLRFQTTPHSIHKLYEGREYAPSIQDIETFVKAVQAYDSAILSLYPLDSTINELQQDIGTDEAKSDSFDLAA